MTRWITQIILSVLAGLVSATLFYFLRASRRAIAIGALISTVLALVLTVWLVGSTSSVELKIVTPVDGVEVGPRTLVKGRGSPGLSDVHVLVHPLRGNRWWVQGATPVQNDGQWQTDVYLGTDTLGVGESFEMLAVAVSDNRWLRRRPEIHLVEGQQLETIPSDLAKSNPIVVKRVR